MKELLAEIESGLDRYPVRSVITGGLWFLLILVVAFCGGIPFVKWKWGVNLLSTYAALAYTIVCMLTLAAIIYAAKVAYDQVTASREQVMVTHQQLQSMQEQLDLAREQAKTASEQLKVMQIQNQVSAVVELYRQYSTPKMLEALIAVSEPDKRPEPDKMKELRRTVSHYWHVAGVMYKAGVIGKDLLHSAVSDSPRIWPKLEFLEIANEMGNRRRNGNRDPEDQLKNEVTNYVRNEHGGYLIYCDWVAEGWISKENLP